MAGRCWCAHDSLAALLLLDKEHGPDGHRLVEDVHDWNTRRRPCSAGLHVSAYPYDTDPGAIAGPGSVIDKRFNRLVLTWAS